MDKEEGVILIDLRDDAHVTDTGPYPAAGEEHQVAGLYIAALDGSVALILVAGRTAYEDVVKAIDIAGEPRTVEAARIVAAAAVF